MSGAVLRAAPTPPPLMRAGVASCVHIREDEGSDTWPTGRNWGNNEPVPRAAQTAAFHQIHQTRDGFVLFDQTPVSTGSSPSRILQGHTLMPGQSLGTQSGLARETRALTKVVKALFRQAIRLLIGTVSYPALTDILRHIYVEEATNKLAQGGNRPTKSAIALLTGLDTRVITATIKEWDEHDEDDLNGDKIQDITPEYALLELWANDPYFQDSETGEPAILPVSGQGKTFQVAIVKAIGRNVTAKTVLDRLTRSGNVKVHRGETDSVELLSPWFFPMSNDQAKMADVGFLEASRILDTVQHNMEAHPNERLPQQGRWTYRFNPKRLDAFREEAKSLLNKHIREGETLLEKYEEPERKKNHITVGMGWYQFERQNKSEESPD